MPAPTNTLLIEGSFEELVDELAQYIDGLKKTHGDENSAIQSECAALLKENQKDEVLKKLVAGSNVLNSAPEKEFIAAYNLLVHLIRQSPNLKLHLPRVCSNLSVPIASSPANGAGLALSILSTIFNTLPPDSENRYHVLFATLRVIRNTTNFETLKPQLRHLDSWLKAWDTTDEEDRKLYLAIADVAAEANEPTESYAYLIKALRTFEAEQTASPDARSLALRALKSALNQPSHFSFSDLTDLDAIQALRQSDPIYFQLLEIFTADLLDDFNDFQDEHTGWIEGEEGLNGEALVRKIRLLTLASIAASAGQTRSLPYSAIAKALQVPQDEVELWVIDVIRAGLVEGKLSQQTQTFLIHRSTYRVFGENQWREVASRLDMWRNGLVSVLSVIKQQKEDFILQREQELREADQKVLDAEQGFKKGGRRGFGGQQQGQKKEVAVDGADE